MARIFPHGWLKAYMDFTSDSESPDDFHFWTGVGTIAGALRRRVWIDEKKFQWTPNFYIVLVGPPGVVAKSTSFRIGMRLLEQVPGIHFGPSSATWQAISDTLSQNVESIRYIDPDTGEEQIERMSCLTLAISELGTFLKVQQEGFVDTLIDWWDGQKSGRSWSHKTLTRGLVEIDNPWLNLLACTTPSWLRSNFPEHMIGGGLTSRMIFVYGDQKRRFVPYPSRLWVGKDHAEIEAALVADLTDIAAMAGPFILDEGAYTWGSSWYEQLWSERPAHMSSDRYGGYIARKQTHLHKIAMVLSASKSSKMLITAEDLAEADALLSSIEPHMIKVFESIGGAEEARRVHEIMQFMKVYRKLTSHELWRHCMNIMSEKDFTAAVVASIKGGMLYATVAGKDVSGQIYYNLTLRPEAPTNIEPTKPKAAKGHEVHVPEMIRGPVGPPITYTPSARPPDWDDLPSFILPEDH